MTENQELSTHAVRRVAKNEPFHREDFFEVTAANTSPHRHRKPAWQSQKQRQDIQVHENESVQPADQS